MVWWMFSAAKFEPLTHPLSKVNANVPMKLLQHRLFPPWHQRLISQQYLCKTMLRNHSAEPGKHFLAAVKPEIMKWQTLNPELNPIENLRLTAEDNAMAKKSTTVSRLRTRWRNSGTKSNGAVVELVTSTLQICQPLQLRRLLQFLIIRNVIFRCLLFYSNKNFYLTLITLVTHWVHTSLFPS